MPHHYYYDNGGMHWGLWIVMIVALLVFFGLLAWVALNITRPRDTHGGAPQPPADTNGSDPLRILDERLARGDIEVDEYTRRRDLLQAGGSAKETG